MSLPHLFNFEAPINNNQQASFPSSNFPTPQYPPGLGSNINTFHGSNTPLNYLIGNHNHALRTLGFGDLNAHFYESPKTVHIDHDPLASYQAQVPQRKNGNNMQNFALGSQLSKVPNKPEEDKNNKKKINNKNKKKESLFSKTPEVEIVEVISDEYMSPVRNKKAPQEQRNLSFSTGKEEGINQLDYFNTLKPQETPFSNMALQNPHNYKPLQNNYHDFYFLNGLSDLLQGDMSNHFNQHLQPKFNFQPSQREFEPQVSYQQNIKQATRIAKVNEPIVIDDSPEHSPENLNEGVKGPSIMMGNFPSFNYPLHYQSHKGFNKIFENPLFQELCQFEQSSQKRPLVDNDPEINAMSVPEKRIEVNANKMVKKKTFNNEEQKKEKVPKKAAKEITKKIKSSSTMDIQIKKKQSLTQKNREALASTLSSQGSLQLSQGEFLPQETSQPKPKESIPKKNSSVKKEKSLSKEGLLVKDSSMEILPQLNWEFHKNLPYFDPTNESGSQQPYPKDLSSQVLSNEKEAYSQLQSQGSFSGVFTQENSEYQYYNQISAVSDPKVEEGALENPSRETKKKEKTAKRTSNFASSLLNKEEAEQPAKKERKLNKLQMLKVAYQNYLEELRKPYTIDIHINPENTDQKIVETKVGENCQIDFGSFDSKPRPETSKKKPVPVWNPDDMNSGQVESYLYRFCQIIGQKVTNEAAMLKNLVQFEMNVENALENIEKHKIFYRNSFRLDQRVLRNRGQAPT